MKVSPFRAFSETRKPAIIVLGLMLFLYICFLLLNNYQSQTNLRETALEQLIQDTEKVALTISYFFSERKSDLENLSKNRSLSVFFENRALGMSMEYGLRASLNSIARQFDRFIREKKFDGRRIYSRVVFVSANAQLLVESSPGNSKKNQEMDWNRFLTPDNPEIKVFDESNAQTVNMIVSCPFFFKQRYVGQIISWIAPENIYDYFIQTDRKGDAYTGLLGRQNRLLLSMNKWPRPNFSDLPDFASMKMEKTRRFEATKQNGKKMDIITVKVPVKGTPFFLVSLLPTSSVLGHTSPTQLLIAMGALAVVFLGGGVVLFRIFTHNLVLRTRFKEASKREQEIEEKNRQLEKEADERKEAEEALMESEERYRTMMEAMKDPVYICSPDYRIVYMNPAMIKRAGGDATGEICFKTLHDYDKKCPWCMHDKVQANEHVESDIVSPKDNRSYHVSQSPIVHGDGSISKMTVFRDTTDLIKLETQLRQAQKMESIGTLAGGIAHDFNNILFPIFGYVEMMLTDIPEDSPLREQLVEVLNGAKRARDLVQQILIFSRQKDHELKLLKVHLVIKEALKLIKSSLPSTIKIIQNIKSDCGLVFADPTQIHQIVMNLCTNGFHAMEETGGKMTVNLKEVELAVEDLKDPSMIPGKYVCLTVIDTGIGMEQSVVDRMFDPYFTTKEEGKGTGLGLAVVHGIVKSHGGQISVYSEPGKGAEFQICLPVIKKQKETAKAENDTPIQKGDERILLVDDQDIIAQLEKQMLERLGYHVTVRTSSPDALELFRKQPAQFDVVITDMTMPNMTGDKLAGELIRIRSDIPVILCTGFSEMMSKEKAESLGIKGFLMKPVVMKDLSNMIRKVLVSK